ncbi:MAG: ATP-binding protein [Spirochaetota bacterium]
MRGSRPLSTQTRLVTAAVVLISLAMLTRAYLEYYGLPLIGYQGRSALVRAGLEKEIRASVEVKRARIATWASIRDRDDLVKHFDFSGLFAALVGGSTDGVSDLSSCVLDGQDLVSLTDNPKLFTPHLRPLPEGELARLGSLVPIEVHDASGASFLAELVRVEPIQGERFGVLVTANLSILTNSLRSELLAITGVTILLILLSVGLIAWMARGIFGPLRALESAVSSYMNGGKAELPGETDGDIGLLIGSFRDLMVRVDNWRAELEKEVRLRTHELEIRSAMDRALANSDEDDRAYSEALEELVDHLYAAGGVFVYFDGSNRAWSVIAGGGGISALDATQLALIEDASGKEGRPFEGLGLDLPFAFATRLVAEDLTVGYVIIGRYDHDFQPDEKVFIARVLREMTPLVYARGERSVQNLIRVEAERALRRSEERLRTFFEESRDMIYTVDADDVFTSINEAGLALLGLANHHDILGSKFSDFALSVEDRAFFLRKMRENGYVTDYEIILEKANGSSVFCLETAQAVRGGDGCIAEIQGIVKDISERINKERELWKTNLELADTNVKLKDTQMLVVQREKLASIGQLAAGIAHEINNPLGFLRSNHSVLQSFLSKLRRAWEEASALDPETHGKIGEKLDLDYVFSEIGALVTESDEGYARIMEIVKNLKNFARADAEISYGPYDLDAGVQSTLVVARNEIKYVADIELRLGGLPPIEAAGGEINQVLLNILVNSAQAIEAQKRKEKGRIVIETRIEGEKAICVIGDDGPGIPENMKLRVLDPFFTTKEPGKGTGLGLSISYDIIVHKHGGRLIVGDSDLGGAEFRLELPVSRPVEKGGPKT